MLKNQACVPFRLKHNTFKNKICYFIQYDLIDGGLVKNWCRFIRRIALFSLLPMFCFAQYFEDLDSIVLGVCGGKWFGGQSYHFKQMVLFDKSITTVLNTSTSHDTVNLIVTHIHGNNSDEFLIKHWPGPSGDPTYVFCRIENGDTLFFGQFGADKIIVPGNGFVYTERRSNEMFNKKRKYKLIDNGFVEIKQPFYSVDIQSKVVQDVVLYSDTSMVVPIVHLAKGQEVQVLLNSDDYYLIETPLGLTGWVRIEFNDDGSIIHDIFILAD